jgi:hypothetical protein
MFVVPIAKQQIDLTTSSHCLPLDFSFALLEITISECVSPVVAQDVTGVKRTMGCSVMH